ncbi:hypothetical protein PLEOSDRAFT_1100613 [Pleurotus ostreatus PC15]|uniref:Uncharacterized protein n=1 Tax=Pleurotus ostreatus (strain PC15) TaxID=1137138 RepID=A0A067P6N7_PLEO1|nr:hypothetical protein PLEOSDRAFT_1100613 [Pleurotus ostreatus PC15]
MAHFVPVSETRLPPSASEERAYFSTSAANWDGVPSRTYHHRHNEWPLQSHTIPWDTRLQNDSRARQIPALSRDYLSSSQTSYYETASSVQDTGSIHQPTPSPPMASKDWIRHDKSPEASSEDVDPPASSPVKEEADGGADPFIMELDCIGEASGMDATPTTCPASFTPEDFSQVTIVPTRGNFPKEMKKLMITLRINSFAIHNGVDRGVIPPWMPDPGPLEEEPRVFQFQIDTGSGGDEEEQNTLEMPDDPELRAFSPDFEIEEDEEAGRWASDVVTSSATPNPPVPSSPTSSWGTNRSQYDRRSSSSASSLAIPTQHVAQPQPPILQTPYHVYSPRVVAPSYTPQNDAPYNHHFNSTRTRSPYPHQSQLHSHPHPQPQYPHITPTFGPYIHANEPYIRQTRMPSSAAIQPPQWTHGFSPNPPRFGGHASFPNTNTHYNIGMMS